LFASKLKRTTARQMAALESMSSGASAGRSLLPVPGGGTAAAPSVSWLSQPPASAQLSSAA
jgi:hypothetical protein